MSKKVIIVLAIICVVWAIALVIVAINKYNKSVDESNTVDDVSQYVEEDYTGSSLSDTDKYKSIDVSKIKLVEMAQTTETKYKTIVLSEEEQIKDVYTKVGQIQLVRSTGTRTSDDDLTIRFVMEDGTKVSFFFEEENIVIGNAQYETDGLSRIRIVLNENS